jgi:dUTP pyrophosphatase
MTTLAAALPFRLLSPQATLPTRAHGGDAGLDLYAAEPARIGPGERTNVGTGVSVQLPPGMAGLVVPRSGLAARHGITLVNTPGVIDAGYRGELRVLLVNLGTQTHRIAPGDRVAQLVVVPVALPAPVEVDALPDSDGRGEGGFGSTGA